MGLSYKKGGLRAYLIWTVATLFYLYEYFVRVIPSVMEVELQNSFKVSTTSLSTSIGMYLMIYSPMQLIVGTLFDLHGGRKLLLPASLILSLSCLLPVIPSDSLFFLGLGRFLMGLTSAFGFVGVMYLCTVWFPTKRLAMLSGLTTGLGMIGAVIAQSSLSCVVEKFNWQATWYISAIFGLVTTIVMWFFLPKRPKWAENFDRGKIWFSFFKSLACVLKNKQIWIIGIAAGSLYLPVSIFADLWGIHYLEALNGFDKKQAAQIISMLYFGWIVGGPIVGWLSDYSKTRKIPMALSCLLCLICVTLFLSINNAPGWVLGLLLFVFGFVSSGEVIGFIAGIEISPYFAKGTAISMVNMIVMAFAGLGIMLIGMILDVVEPASTAITTGHHSVKALKIALSIMPITLLISTALTFFCMKETFQEKKEE